MNSFTYSYPYFLVKLFVDIILYRSLPIIFLLPCYFLSNMKYNLINILYFIIILILFSINLGLTNFIICCFFKNERVSITVIAFSILIGMFSTGFFFNGVDLPFYINIFKYLNFWNYSFRSLIYNEINGRFFYSEKLGGIISGDSLMAMFGVLPESFSNYIKILLIYTIILIICGRYSLKFFVTN